jgi:hypothetical protein
MNIRKWIAVSAIGAVLLLAGCSKFTEPYNDAPVSSKDDSTAEVYSMPDGFSNVASKCDKHGHRIFVAYHGDSPYGAIAAIDDPSCPK